MRPNDVNGADALRLPMGRVKVDLTNFFGDERRFCCKSLDLQALGRVGDLKSLLRTEFALPGHLTLVLGDCCLIDSDNIRVLRDGEIIKVIKSTRGEKTVNGHIPATPVSNPHPKADKPPLPSPSPCRMEVSESPRNGALTEPLSEGLEWMNDPLQKRIRRRRRRGGKKGPTESDPEEVEEPRPKPYRPPKMGARHDANRKHIRFGEEVDAVEEPELPTNGANGHPEPKLDLELPFEPVVFKRRFTVREETVEEVPFYHSLTDQQLFDLPSMTDRPKVEDILAYRILYIGENCTPELSGWLIAKVTFDGPSGLGLQLLRGTNPSYRPKQEDHEGGEEEDNLRPDFMTMLFENLSVVRLIVPPKLQQ